MTINGVLGLEETGVLYATVNRHTAPQRQTSLIHSATNYIHNYICVSQRGISQRGIS